MIEPKIAIPRILVDLNLAVQYGIAIRIFVSRKFGDFFPCQNFQLYGMYFVFGVESLCYT